MAIINGVDMPNFEASEFSENPEVFANPLLLMRIQRYRTLLDGPFYPSPARGALARFGDDEERDSIHYSEPGASILSKALDGFPDCDIFKAWTIAQKCGLFNGIGVYFDTKRNGILQPMLHLDIRKAPPLIWFRAKGKYFYPWDDNFYKNLMNAFATWQGTSETKIKQEIRIVLGLTMQEFCKEYNINPGTVSGWSRGRRPISPRHVTILKKKGFSEDSLRNPGEIA